MDDFRDYFCIFCSFSLKFANFSLFPQKSPSIPRDPLQHGHGFRGVALFQGLYQVIDCIAIGFRPRARFGNNRLPIPRYQCPGWHCHSVQANLTLYLFKFTNHPRVFTCLVCCHILFVVMRFQVCGLIREVGICECVALVESPSWVLT